MHSWGPTAQHSTEAPSTNKRQEEELVSCMQSRHTATLIFSFSLFLLINWLARMGSLASDHNEDDQVPTIDYLMLFSTDPHQRSKALDHFTHACLDFGFFYVITHIYLYTHTIKQIYSWIFFFLFMFTFYFFPNLHIIVFVINLYLWSLHIYIISVCVAVGESWYS